MGIHGSYHIASLSSCCHAVPRLLGQPPLRQTARLGPRHQQADRCKTSGEGVPKQGHLARAFWTSSPNRFKIAPVRKGKSAKIGNPKTIRVHSI